MSSYRFYQEFETCGKQTFNIFLNMHCLKNILSTKVIHATISHPIRTSRNRSEMLSHHGSRMQECLGNTIGMIRQLMFFKIITRL